MASRILKLTSTIRALPKAGAVQVSHIKNSDIEQTKSY